MQGCTFKPQQLLQLEWALEPQQRVTTISILTLLHLDILCRIQQRSTMHCAGWGGFSLHCLCSRGQLPVRAGWAAGGATAPGTRSAGRGVAVQWEGSRNYWHQ